MVSNPQHLSPPSILPQADTPMVKIFEKLMVLLDRQQKRKMVLLVFLMLIGAVLETLGVSMILPVMNVVLEEDAIAQHEYLQLICRIFHIDNSVT